MSLNENGFLSVNQEDTQQGRYLTFVLDENIFGIEIKYVREIIGVQPITKLPEVPDFIKGIINLRGKIIPVIDMRIKFGKHPIAYNDRTCFIVIEVKELAVGMIVDNVAEVLSLDDKEIVAPPEGGLATENKYISGIGKIGDKICLLLDCEQMFDEIEEE